MSNTRPMTLVHIVTVPQSLHFLRGQGRFMKRHGFVVHAISSPGEELDRFGTAEEVVTHSVSMSRGISPFRDIVSLIRLIVIIRGLRPDIVHSHTPKAGLLGMIASFVCRVPVRIYHLHGFRGETATGVKRAILILCDRLACHLATRVLCVSPSLQELIVRQGICRPEKMVVLGLGSANGVDAAWQFNPDRVQSSRSQVRMQLGIAESARVIGFVGRLVRDKGLVELSEAWTRLRDEFADLHLLLVGETEELDPVPSHVLELLRRDTRVHFVGKVHDVSVYYAAMDLVVLPTYREGFPNVLLEASAMKLPVVSTRVTGVVDAVCDGVTGTLVQPRDAVALAEAIRRYLVNPELAHAHGLAGRERVLAHYIPESIWTALYHEYNGLLQTAGLVSRTC